MFIDMKKKFLIKTKYGSFQAEIWFNGKEKVYFIKIPAFPGPMTEAQTLTEAKRYAGELIELEALEALEHGKAIIDDTRRVYSKSIQSGVVTLA